MDDLAIMVAKGFSGVDKHFDQVNKRFEYLENDLKSFKTETKENFTKVEENFKKVRNDILDIGDRFVPRHEFDSLLVRFNHLDQKVRAKLK